MIPNDDKIRTLTDLALTTCEKKTTLVGIKSKVARNAFIEQIVDSCRRVKYVNIVASKKIDKEVADPYNQGFDPIKAAIYWNSKGNYDEACWLVFLAIHFGKHRTTKWNLARNFYAGIDRNNLWTWSAITADTQSFLAWLNVNEAKLKACGKFGNHRKYENLSAYKKRCTGATIQSYINWIDPSQGHANKFNQLIGLTSNSRDAFHEIYNSMSNVISFGRMGKFDFISMLGKTSLLLVEPGSTYMNEATGPLRGARLLITGKTTGNLSATQCSRIVDTIESALNLPFGMQILEDAICNWQKSPTKYIRFI